MRKIREKVTCTVWLSMPISTQECFKSWQMSWGPSVLKCWGYLTLWHLRVTCIYFLFTISPLNSTSMQWEESTWSPSVEDLDWYNKFSSQYHKNCMKDSIENIQTDFRWKGITLDWTGLPSHPEVGVREGRGGEGWGELLPIILYCYNWDDNKGSTVAVRAIWLKQKFTCYLYKGI